MDELEKLEPRLAELVVSKYEGEKDEEGYYEGRGRATYRGGQWYEGEFRGGMMHGRGRYVWPDGTEYSGEFAKNALSGVGEYAWPDGSRYKGEVRNGLREGEGVLEGEQEKKKYKYEGSWRRGQRDGLGTMYFDVAGKTSYTGQWVADKREGQGTMRYASGNEYRGEWKDDVKEGQGTMTWRDRGEYYVGSWCKDRQNGHGEHVWSNPSGDDVRKAQRPTCNRYRGEWKDGKRHGKGTFIYATGALFQGTFVDGKKDGPGALIREDGAVYVGDFTGDKMVSGQPANAVEGLSSRPHAYVFARDVLPSVGFEDELVDVHKAILRYASEFKALYKAYSDRPLRKANGHDPLFPESSSNGRATREDAQHSTQHHLVDALTVGQFWDFCHECRIAPNISTIAAVDAMLLVGRRAQRVFVDSAVRVFSEEQMGLPRPEGYPPPSEPRDVIVQDDAFDVLNGVDMGYHSPDRPLSYRDFVEAVVRLAVAGSAQAVPRVTTDVALTKLFKDLVLPVFAKINDPAPEIADCLELDQAERDGFPAAWDRACDLDDRVAASLRRAARAILALATNDLHTICSRHLTWFADCLARRVLEKDGAVSTTTTTSETNSENRGVFFAALLRAVRVVCPRTGPPITAFCEVQFTPIQAAQVAMHVLAVLKFGLPVQTPVEIPVEMRDPDPPEPDANDDTPPNADDASDTQLDADAAAAAADTEGQKPEDEAAAEGQEENADEPQQPDPPAPAEPPPQKLVLTVADVTEAALAAVQHFDDAIQDCLKRRSDYDNCSVDKKDLTENSVNECVDEARAALVEGEDGSLDPATHPPQNNLGGTTPDDDPNIQTT